MKLTRKAFQMLFGVHVPDWAPYAMAGGVKYEFVQTLEGEMSELESLIGNNELTHR